MGKNSKKSKKPLRDKSAVDLNSSTQIKPTQPYDKDTTIFIYMANELKDEGNRFFQIRDYEGAMLKYQKAIKLLPRNHLDVSSLRSNMAACYMQLGITEFPRAIHECNLALEVTPKYTKALLKRARCYEALNRLDLALRDVGSVLKMEKNNIMAIEIEERVRNTIQMQGSTKVNDIPMDLVPLPEYIEPPSSPQTKVKEEKAKKKKKRDIEDKKVIGLEYEDKREGDEKEREVKIDARKSAVETVVRESENKREGDEKKKEMKAKVRKVNNGTVVKKSEDNIQDKRKGDDMESGVKEPKENTDYREGGEKKKEVKIKVGKANENIVVRKLEDNIEENKDMIEGDEKQMEITDVKKSKDIIEEKKTEDKLVVEKNVISDGVEEEPKRTVKLVFGEDIRWAQIPLNCDLLKLRQIISDRFPTLKSILVKYRDQEGDLVTITTTEELRWAEASTEHGSVKLYIVEVNPEQDPFFKKRPVGKNNDVNNSELICISDWIIQFAQFFKNYVGFDVDAYLDLHEVGVKLYSEAMEETVTSEEAQDLFNTAAEKFQEMTALALFNWGNVHMSRARKRVHFSEDSSRESVLAQGKSAYDWAQKEYICAGQRYEEALKIKPNFYEAILALGQQQFEQAKLSWYYIVGTNVDLETWQSSDVLQLYNNAEENVEKGMQMWEEEEANRLNELSKPNKIETLLQKMKLGNLFKHVSPDEAAEQAENIRSQIYVFWGTILYERSIMEFKLGLPVWHECFEVSIEKFELAGASPTNIGVMINNHCSNDTTSEGFHVDEIVQAWNEMHEAKRLQNSIPSFRLEPLLKRRVSKLYYALEHA